MVNISKLKLTLLQQDILRLMFIKAGVSINGRAISKSLNVSQPAVSKALPKLIKHELITLTKDKESKRLAIELNREHQEVIWLKRADNLKQIYESGLAQFLYDSLPGTTIVLFGSYAFGEDTIISDIDLAIIGNKKKLKMDKYEYILQRKINVNNYDSFEKIDNKLLNNILNGILIKGSVDI